MIKFTKPAVELVGSIPSMLLTAKAMCWPMARRIWRNCRKRLDTNVAATKLMAAGHVATRFHIVSARHARQNQDVGRRIGENDIFGVRGDGGSYDAVREQGRHITGLLATSPSNCGDWKLERSVLMKQQDQRTGIESYDVFDEALYFDKKDLSKALKCSERHIDNLKSRGEIPPPIKFGRLTRWQKSAFLHWIEAGCPAISA
jgi:predicted DNA-binding transcriptional regulator AlpA